ncbi:MAG: exosortase/archaeosortase family protein [Saprospiraceae bacterium]
MKAINSPVTQFLLYFAGGMLLFYIFYYSPIYENWIMPALLHFQAWLGSLLLKVFGEWTRVEGDQIIGEKFSVSIHGGCDGMEATFLYIIALLALPLVSLKEKYPALFYGVLTLSVLNIFRISLLYYAGVYWPRMFEFMHVHGGVIAFTMISIILWLFFVNRILGKRNKSQTS